MSLAQLPRASVIARISAMVEQVQRLAFRDGGRQEFTFGSWLAVQIPHRHDGVDEHQLDADLFAFRTGTPD